MVCKEEVCDWFRGLSGPKQVDLLTRLVHMCHPLEIRFTGSCLEDIAKKDFHILRESELRANDPSECRKMTNVLDPSIRSKLNVYMALLYSHNTACSTILYNTLSSIDSVIRNIPDCDLSEALMEELINLLTLAIHHPAFTFSQNQQLRKNLESVRERCSELVGEGTTDGISFADAHETYSYVPDRNQEQQELLHLTAAITTNGPRHHYGFHGTVNTVYVRNIELHGSRRKEADKHSEFDIKVTWSDGTVTETCRTYQELNNFHAELLVMFPKDAEKRKQDIQLPNFPKEKGPSHHKDLAEQVKKYFRLLTNLPEYVIQNEMVSRYFASTPLLSPAFDIGLLHTAQRCSATDSISPITVKASVSEENVQNYPPVLRSMTIYNSEHRDATQGNAPKSVIYPGVPTVNHRLPHPNPHPNMTNSPSPLNSPVHSPHSSPQVSPSPSISSSRSISPGGHFDLQKWLKTMRLHKYHEFLKKYSLQQLLKLKDKELEAETLTFGARNKFKQAVHLLKKELAMNGTVGGASGLRSHSPSSPPETWQTPPSCSSYLPPPPPSSHPSVTSSHESSPSCSEYSSPPASPGPTDAKPTQDSLSSEEFLDRDLDQLDLDRDSLFSPQSSHSSCELQGSVTIGGIPMHNHSPNIKPNPEHMLPLMGTYPLPPNFGLRHMVPNADNHPMQLQFGMPMNPRSPRPQGKPVIHGSTNIMSAPKLPNNGAGMYRFEGIHGGYGPKISGQGPNFNYDIPAASTSTVITVAGTSTETMATFKANANMVPCTLVPNTPSIQMVSRPNSLGIHAPQTFNSNNNNTTVPSTLPSISTVQQVVAMDNKGMLPYPNASQDGAYTAQNITMTVTSNASPGPSPPLPTGNPNSGQVPPPQIPNATTPCSAAPPQTPTSQPPSGCSACGCNGHCNGPQGNIGMQYSSYMWHPHPQFVYPHMRFLPPGTTNGIIQPTNYSFHRNTHHPQMTLPNGLTAEVLPPGHHNFHGAFRHPAAMVPPNCVPMNNRNHTPPLHTGPKGKVMCHNCGSNEHFAGDCKESTFGAINHFGHYHLNYKPKSDSE